MGEEVAEQGPIQPTADEGGRLEQGLIGGGDASQAALHHLLNAPCKNGAGQGHGRYLFQPPHFFGKGAEHFDYEEGVAFGLVVDELNEVGLAAVFAQRGGAQIGYLGGRETAEGEQLRVGKLLGEGRPFSRPITADNGEGVFGRLGAEEGEEVEAVRVELVQIF